MKSKFLTQNTNEFSKSPHPILKKTIKPQPSIETKDDRRYKSRRSNDDVSITNSIELFRTDSFLNNRTSRNRFGENTTSFSVHSRKERVRRHNIGPGFNFIENEEVQNLPLQYDALPRNVDKKKKSGNNFGPGFNYVDDNMQLTRAHYEIIM